MLNSDGTFEPEKSPTSEEGALFKSEKSEIWTFSRPFPDDQPNLGW